MFIGFDGKMFESDGMLSVEVPPLLVFTQGENEEDGIEMVNDALSGLLEDEGVEFDQTKTIWLDKGERTFRVYLPLEQPAIAFMLRQLRGHKNMSLSSAAKEMGLKLKNNIAAYEKIGGPTPSIEKLDQFFKTYQVKAEVAIGV